MFSATFGTEPTAVWISPGRVNLLGEHTDYNRGLCLPMALDFGVECAGALTSTGRVRVCSAQRPGELIEVEHLAPGTGWADYVLGCLWVLQGEGVDVPGLDLALDSDVPEGSGLSSSAALECAALATMSELLGLPREPRLLAQRAQRAENDFVGVPCGLMDQTVSACAQEGHALRFDARSLQVRQLPYRDQVLVLDTRAPHQLVDGSYAERRQQCEQAAQLLGVSSLREASSLVGLDGVLLRRARHVVAEIARVERAVQDPAALAALMTSSHISLRDDFEVSVPELDVAAETALEAGARGARMTGGGFGGSIVALAPEPAETAAAIERAFADRGWLEPRWFVATAAAGTRPVPAT